MSVLLFACGGQSRVYEQASFGSGAAGGSAASAAGGASGTETSGADGMMPVECQHPAEDYVAGSEADCLRMSFRCASGSAVFVDDCGCGCNRRPFESETGVVAVYPDVLDPNCGGIEGPLAMFERRPEQLAIGENAVFVWIRGSGLAGVADVWAIDKRTGDVTLLPSGSPEVQVPPGSVVSGAAGFEGDGAGYYTAVAGSLVRESQTGVEVLFELAGEISAFVVIDREVYATAEDGALRRGFVAPTVESPVVVEQRGGLDPDDYTLIVAADEEAVYWTAGPGQDVRVSDGQPLMLFRFCR